MQPYGWHGNQQFKLVGGFKLLPMAFPELVKLQRNGQEKREHARTTWAQGMTQCAFVLAATGTVPVNKGSLLNPYNEQLGAIA
eukprot:1160588-Pelagomonas_calceolata.AAC.6